MLELVVLRAGKGNIYLKQRGGAVDDAERVAQWLSVGCPYTVLLKIDGVNRSAWNEGQRQDL